MGYINVKIDDDLERQFRTKLSAKGGKRGDLAKAIEESMKLWIKVQEAQA